MNYTEMIDQDVVNGTGIRVALFVAGCDHRCKGCFNKLSQSYKVGKLFTIEDEERLIQALDKPYIDGLSILGGDPLANGNVNDIYNLLRRIKHRLPKKTVWLWTGDTLEQIQLSSKKKAIVDNYVDYLVDGEFVEELKDLKLSFRGSSNQKIYHKGVDVTDQFTV